MRTQTALLIVALMSATAWAIVLYAWFANGAIEPMALSAAAMLSFVVLVMPLFAQREEADLPWCHECQGPTKRAFGCGFCLGCGRFLSAQAEAAWRKHT